MTLVYLIYALLVQLVAYGVLWWMVFVGMAFVGARWLGVPGIFLGHVLLAIVIAMLDVRWVQGEMRKPGWNGVPDQDVVFVFGVLVRIVLVNVVLLPVSVAGWRWGRRDCGL